METTPALEGLYRDSGMMREGMEVDLFLTLKFFLLLELEAVPPISKDSSFPIALPV